MRKIFTTMLMLRAAHAFSLSSFQRLTTTAISTNCQNVYNSEIPSCLEEDFTKKCSSSCISGLSLVAEKIYSACNSTCASPTSLLGMVLSGEILKSLCLIPSSETTLTFSKSSPTPVRSGSKSINSCVTPKTITRSLEPTTLYLTIEPLEPTEIPTTSELSFIFPSVVSPTTRSSLFTATILSTSTIISPASTRQTTTVQPLVPKTSSSSSLSTSTISSAEPTVKPFTGGSGGGSPFDFQSRSSTSQTGKSSLCAMALALFLTCLLYR